MSVPEQTAPGRWRSSRRLSISAGVISDFAIILAFVGLFITLALVSDAFFTSRNLLNILDQWSPVMFMALGGTLVLIAGGFDLSIGAIYAVSGVLAVQIANKTGGEIGLIVGVLAGGLMGLLNGLLVTVLSMNVFVATIGTSIVLGGFGTVITEGRVETTTAANFEFLGTAEILGINLSIWLMLIAIGACMVLLNRTTIGRYIRAVGGNIEAARLSGIRTQRVRAFTFVASGLGGGLAGAIVASRSVSANIAAFTNISFAVWTALLIGGNSMIGGEGAVWRTVVGVGLLALIGNGFDLLNVDPFYQQVATGGILLLAVAIDTQVRRRRRG